MNLENSFIDVSIRAYKSIQKRPQIGKKKRVENGKVDSKYKPHLFKGNFKGY
jgi:hypothetical protein